MSVFQIPVEFCKMHWTNVLNSMFTIAPLNKSPLTEVQTGSIFLSIITGSWDTCIKSWKLKTKADFINKNLPLWHFRE